jgi:hypothetical protein
VSENPWHRLPDIPPYVLPDEAAAVREFNLTASRHHFLHVDDLLPEPFIGDRNAPVLLLGNNPGFSEAGLPGRREPTFARRMRDNLLHRPAEHPFVYLDPDFNGRSKRWWERKLKHLLERFGTRVVANSILAVEHFPYPSRRYGHRRLVLPSQDYSFRLVGEAMARGAVIILMRGKRRWERAVFGLAQYKRFIILKNLQQPTVSPGNCPRFEEVVRAVEAA